VDLRYMQGLRGVLASMGPGLVSRFSFGSPGAADPILVQAHRLSCMTNGREMVLESKTTLPDITLFPGVPYLAVWSGGGIEVVPAG
jgi:hypothetical protein